MLFSKVSAKLAIWRSNATQKPKDLHGKKQQFTQTE